MEATVKEVLFTGSTADQSLALLLNLTMKEVSAGRYLFSNPLEEPIFYSRYFKKWVSEAVESIQKMRKKDE